MSFVDRNLPPVYLGDLYRITHNIVPVRLGLLSLPHARKAKIVVSFAGMIGLLTAFMLIGLNKDADASLHRTMTWATIISGALFAAWTAWNFSEIRAIFRNESIQTQRYVVQTAASTGQSDAPNLEAGITAEGPLFNARIPWTDIFGTLLSSAGLHVLCARGCVITMPLNSRGLDANLERINAVRSAIDAAAASAGTHAERVLAVLDSVRPSCPHCKYRLGGTGSTICPECGVDLAACPDPKLSGEALWHLSAIGSPFNESRRG